MNKWPFVILAILIIAGVGGGVAVKALGIRNNNPGNIRATNIKWRGQVGSNKGFVVFDTPENGIRALAINLRNKQRLHFLNTVEKIIGDPVWGWAPATENDTKSYINAVARAMNVKPSQRINLEERAVVAAMTKAIIKHENGYQPYDVAMIDQQVAIA